MDTSVRVGHRSSSYFSGGGCMMSPSCLPVVQDEFHYSRIPHNYAANAKTRSRGWRNLLRKFMRESKNLHGSKPPSFQYDPVSYSHNFDDGSNLHDQPRRLSFIFQDFRDGGLDGFDCRCKV